MTEKQDKKIRELTLTAVLASAAVIVNVIESSLPPLTPVYGVRLGLANVLTLFAIYALGRKQALAVLIIRIALGNLLTGQAVSFVYSLSGGLLAYFAMLVLIRLIPFEQLWVIGGISAVFHNIGQITVAVAITQTAEIIFYLPLLVVSGVISGILTGTASCLVLKNLDKAGYVKIRHYKKLHKSEDKG